MERIGRAVHMHTGLFVGRVTLSSFRIHAPRGVYLLHASAAYFPPTSHMQRYMQRHLWRRGRDGASRKTVATKASVQ